LGKGEGKERKGKKGREDMAKLELMTKGKGGRRITNQER
jgi:hypothetical protein